MKPKIEPGIYCTTAEAAAILKISIRGVRKILDHRDKTGKFPGAIKRGRDWLIPKTDLQAQLQK